MEPKTALLLWIIGGEMLKIHSSRFVVQQASHAVLPLRAGCLGQKQEKVGINQRVGCFKDEPDRRDLPHRITSADALGSVENCVNACAAKYYM